MQRTSNGTKQRIRVQVAEEAAFWRLQQLRQAAWLLRNAGEVELADALLAWADQLAMSSAKDRCQEWVSPENWLG